MNPTHISTLSPQVALITMLSMQTASLSYAFSAPAAPSRASVRMETKEDLQALAVAQNPTVGFWDPIGLADANLFDLGEEGWEGVGCGARIVLKDNLQLSALRVRALCHPQVRDRRADLADCQVAHEEADVQAAAVRTEGPRARAFVADPYLSVRLLIGQLRVAPTNVLDLSYGPAAIDGAPKRLLESSDAISPCVRGFEGSLCVAARKHVERDVARKHTF